MTTPTPDPAQIEQLIQQDNSASIALLTALRCEQEALKSRKHQDLQRLLEEKNHYLLILESNASKRQQILQHNGRETDNNAWEILLAELDARTPGTALLDAWNTLKNHFSECRTLNEINGKMIARGQQTISRLLNILRGQTAAPGLYSASGNTTQSNRSGASSYTTVIKA
jgi:flagellar biosynthesis protein FlgN